MGALSIAFDITIVGALAASWVVLVVDLFFVSKEQHLRDALKSAAKDIQPGVLAVLLFAVGFFLGSAVSRISQDFFNDDDLWVGLQLHGHSVTEDNIRVRTYCDSDIEVFAALEPSKTLVTDQELHGLCSDYAARTTSPGPKSSLDI
jgi:hypothetical protein